VFRGRRELRITHEGACLRQIFIYYDTMRHEKLHFPSFFSPTFLVNSSKFQRIDRNQAEVRMSGSFGCPGWFCHVIIQFFPPVKFDHASRNNERQASSSIKIGSSSNQKRVQYCIGVVVITAYQSITIFFQHQHVQGKTAAAAKAEDGKL